MSRLEALAIAIWQLDPLGASSYHRLPAWIINKRAVTNVRNTGNDCFKWAFLAGMHPIKRNSGRLKKEESFESKYDFSSLTYPDIDTTIPSMFMILVVVKIIKIISKVMISKMIKKMMMISNMIMVSKMTMLISMMVMMISKMIKSKKMSKKMTKKLMIVKTILNVMLTSRKRKKWYIH